jgi:hypothetical protein
MSENLGAAPEEIYSEYKRAVDEAEETNSAEAPTEARLVVKAQKDATIELAQMHKDENLDKYIEQAVQDVEAETGEKPILAPEEGSDASK